MRQVASLWTFEGGFIPRLRRGGHTSVVVSRIHAGRGLTTEMVRYPDRDRAHKAALIKQPYRKTYVREYVVALNSIKARWGFTSAEVDVFL